MREIIQHYYVYVNIKKCLLWGDVNESCVAIAMGDEMK